MLYKDACNEKSNQKNLGTIKSSNLCTEIVEYTAPDEIAVCNLASIALPRFVINNKFDHQKLFDITYVITKNLNKVIDINYYPVEAARKTAGVTPSLSPATADQDLCARLQRDIAPLKTRR